mgnify:CR=1 FL=1
MSSTGMHRGRVGSSAAALATEAERRPSSFKAGTSRTISYVGPTSPAALAVGRVGEAVLALEVRSRELHGHMPRGRVGCSAAALKTEADGRPSSFKAGTSRTICGPPPLTVGRVGEATLA